MLYRCNTSSPEGLVQVVARNYLNSGYVFYIAKSHPDGRDYDAIDRRIIEKYEINISKFKRARRKRAGFGNVHYIRYQSFYLLLATPGEHEIFFNSDRDANGHLLPPEQRGERASLQDARRTPIKFAGYSMSVTKDGVKVRIEREHYRDLRAFFAEIATHWSKKNIEEELKKTLKFCPYAPIQAQQHSIISMINDKRKRAGYQRIATNLFPKRYTPCKPYFEQQDSATVGHIKS